MDSSAHTVRIQPLSKKKEKDPKGNTKILSSRINFEDPTALLQTRTLLANFIRGNLNSKTNPCPNQ
ncbi:unnamed protein product [Paramecium primaurelia]|uniref:Uncharacterized protein n=2 Tax=Paramecium TaxID=5884 RepID=A0A8S1W374_9CILI|nr:unnamed protein product [Paramecium primaurelia]CAD8183127.1 unnamed protein product [Paramecium pentaurelia]